MRVLCLGDIFGIEGVEAVKEYVSKVRENYDFIIVNGENAAGGFGITKDISTTLFDSGVNVITSGNHIWRKREIFEYMDSNKNILRPYNFGDVQGNGYVIYRLPNGDKVAVVNIQGEVFMPEVHESPFVAIERILDIVTKETSKIIVDFHAEATSEKISMGYFLDGRTSLVFGTHTHVQTNDARILDLGTGYCTDLGMCGSHSGVIGVRRDIILSRFLKISPNRKFEPSSGKVFIHGLQANIGDDGRCNNVEVVKVEVT